MKRGLLLLVGVGWLAAAAVCGQTLAERDPEFDAAKAALDDGFYDTAANLFERYINNTAAKRKKAYGAIFLFNAWHGLGQHEKIMAWLRENWSTIMKGTRYDGAATYWYARAKYATEQYDDALRYLRDFETNFPGDEFLPFVVRLRGEALRASRQLDEAEEMFARFHAEFPGHEDTPANLLDWAEVLIRLKRNEDARARLEQLTEQYPRHAASHRARLWLGQWELEAKRPERAALLLAPLAGHTNAPPALRADAWFALASAAMEQNNLTNALVALQQGEHLAVDPERKVESRIDQARLLMQLNRLVEATALMRETIATHAAAPRAAGVQLELADLLRAQSRYEAAAEAYQNYLESFTDPAGIRHALLSKAWCLWQLERYGEAAVTFEKAHAELRNEFLKEQALVKAADAYFLNSQYRLAAAAYEKALISFPESGERHTMMYQAGLSYARLADVTNTTRMLRGVTGDTTAKEDLVLASTMRLARFFEEQRAWEDAITAYDEVLTRFAGSAQYPAALSARALLKFRLARHADALKDFDTIRENYPDTAWAEQAVFMRARCIYQMGETAEALRAGRDFLGAYTNSVWRPEVIFWLAEHEYNVQGYRSAETNFAALAAEYPGHALAAPALYWAGRATLEQKAPRRALDEYLNVLTRQYPDHTMVPEARFAQGDALTELEDYAGAILAFEAITTGFPDHPLAVRALGRIGDCQFSLGRDRPARFQESIEIFRAVMNHPQATRDLVIQAEYKMGRAYESLGLTKEAATHYRGAAYDWLAARAEGLPAEEVWFVRAAFGAAALHEAAGERDEAIAIYQRVVDSGLTAAADAVIRIDRIRNQRQNTEPKPAGEKATPAANKTGNGA